MRINNFSSQITILKTFPTDRPGRPGRPRKQADGPAQKMGQADGPSDWAVGPVHFLGRSRPARRPGPFSGPAHFQPGRRPIWAGSGWPGRAECQHYLKHRIFRYSFNFILVSGNSDIF